VVRYWNTCKDLLELHDRGTLLSEEKFMVNAVFQRLLQGFGRDSKTTNLENSEEEYHWIGYMVNALDHSDDFAESLQEEHLQHLLKPKEAIAKAEYLLYLLERLQACQRHCPGR